jgi:hypothetical protein
MSDTSFLHYVGAYPVQLGGTKRGYCFLTEDTRPNTGKCPYGFNSPPRSWVNHIPKDAARILLSYPDVTAEIKSLQHFVVMVDLSYLPTVLVSIDPRPTINDVEIQQAFEQSSSLSIPVVYTNIYSDTSVLQIL